MIPAGLTVVMVAFALLTACGRQPAAAADGEPPDAIHADSDGLIKDDTGRSADALDPDSPDQPGDSSFEQDALTVQLPCGATIVTEAKLHALFRPSEDRVGVMEGTLSWSDCRRPITKCMWQVGSDAPVVQTQQCELAVPYGTPVSLTVFDSAGDLDFADEPFAPGVKGLVIVRPPALAAVSDIPAFLGLAFSSQCDSAVDPVVLNADTKCILTRHTEVVVEQASDDQGIGAPLPAAVATCESWQATLSSQPIHGVVAYLIVRSPTDQLGKSGIVSVKVHGGDALHFQIPGLLASQAIVVARVQFSGCAPEHEVEQCSLAAGKLHFDGVAGVPCVVPWQD